MASILYRTKSKDHPKGKPRVFFTCHPADFDKYFETICSDIFATHDCAIYYTADMTEPIPEADWETDLESNNLFVVPVSFQLLSQPNRAMDADIPFAFEKHIPVLPIMMEPALDTLYSRPNKFGQLQYLTHNCTDSTQIPYGEKLKKYLSSVLISDKMAKRVRAAFDAYIFLSYRKKDRHYANELMRLIHNNPEYRDIAIWYDEFLTPGENFRENIEKVMQNSRLFTLLVTPNLLEEPGGKPNFVMGEEYPTAQKIGINILPAEMEATNKKRLQEKFSRIPRCVDARNDAALRKHLLNAIENLTVDDNNNDPEHMYLIGRAYLDGIDVETDRQRGIELITHAAEADYPEAMAKLCHMYDNGIVVRMDYREAVKWAERLTDYYTRTYGEEHPDTLSSLSNLACTYSHLGDLKKELETYEKTYALYCRVFGEAHPDTLSSLSDLAYTYGRVGDFKKSYELQEKAYVLLRKTLGEEHPDTLDALNNLTYPCIQMGDHEKNVELCEKVYTLRCKILGEENPETVASLSNLALSYRNAGDLNKALVMFNKVYDLFCKIEGAESPSSAKALNNLALIHGNMGNHEKALELHKEAYALYCRLFGEENPDTSISLDNLASAYGAMGYRKKELELREKAYTQLRESVGEEHFLTLVALRNMVSDYYELDDYEKGVELAERLYTLQCKVFGEEHPETMQTLKKLAYFYNKLGNHKKSVTLKEKEYTLLCRILGERHPDAVTSLIYLAAVHSEWGDLRKGEQLFGKAYALQEEMLGQEHPDTQQTAQLITQVRQKIRTRNAYKKDNLCWYCGGAFKGLFRKQCSKCGEPKNY